jgi:hypothetical protein
MKKENIKKEKGYLLYTNSGFYNINDKTLLPELNLTQARMFKDIKELRLVQKRLLNKKDIYIRTLTVKVY